MNTMLDDAHLKVVDKWMAIWNLNSPPKIKDFLWRFVRGYIPMRKKLNSKGILCPPSCTYCLNFLEDD